MKKQVSKKHFSFILIILFSVLILASSCNKEASGETGKKPPPMGSTIIYTDVKPDSVIFKDSAILKMGPASSFSLDLNNDGINDFQFNSTKRLCGDGLSAPTVNRLYISVQPASGGVAIMTNNVIPSISDLGAAFDSAVVIAPGSLWVSTSRVLLSGASWGSMRCMFPMGYWLNVSDKYLGLKFIKGNSTYYGWARLTSSYYSAPFGIYRHLTGGQLILKDYAYNSTPNQPILAGQTK